MSYTIEDYRRELGVADSDRAHVVSAHPGEMRHAARSWGLQSSVAVPRSVRAGPVGMGAPKDG